MAFHVQLLLGCTALNLKRLESRGGKEGEGWAAGAVGLIAGASSQQHLIGRRSGDQPGSNSSAYQPITVAVWSLCVSLN